jgi:superoxide dismutase, Cu-Zn family
MQLPGSENVAQVANEICTGPNHFKEAVFMSYQKLFLILALMGAPAAFGQSAPPQSAHADVINAQGQKIGTATLVQTDAGVRVDLSVSQLTPGTHGVHLHAAAKCEAPAFTTAAGHFNPDMKKHGAENPDGPHAGDLTNIEVAADGTAKVSAIDSRVTLGDGPNSLFRDAGTALVIHEKADDNKTDPSGNSGARVACGVIQR